MAALQRAQEERALRRVLLIVRKRYPDHPAIRGEADENALALLQRFLIEARGFGMDGGKEIADYIGLKFEIGFSVHEHPLVHSVLSQDEIAAGQRIDRLFSLLQAPDWADVRSFCANRIAANAPH